MLNNCLHILVLSLTDIIKAVSSRRLNFLLAHRISKYNHSKTESSFNSINLLYISKEPQKCVIITVQLSF